MTRRKQIRNGEEMMDALVDDIFRYESLAENDAKAIFRNLTYSDRSEGDLPLELSEIVHHDRNVNKNVTDFSHGDTPDIPVDLNVDDSVQSRFVQYSDADTDEYVIKNMNKNTMYKTSSDVKLFKTYLNEIQELREIEDIPPVDLDKYIARFVLGARPKNFHIDSKEYEPDTLTSIHNSLDRYLKQKKVQFSIKRDSLFAHSNKCLEEKRKVLKSHGVGNKDKAAECLTKEEIDLLYNKNILGAGNPESLLNTVWLNNGVYFGLRGRQDHLNLRWGDIKLKCTTDGKEYLEFFERNTKTRTGAKRGDTRQVNPKAFAIPDNERCPVKIYKLYKQHRPPDMVTDPSRFYLRSLVNPKTDVWYSHQPIGKDKLGQKMKDLASQGNIEGLKVNHSVRKTFASSLIHPDVPPTEVAKLGGWKNVNSVNHYAVPSLQQQEEASNIISNIMAPTTSYTSLSASELHCDQDYSDTAATVIEKENLSDTSNCFTSSHNNSAINNKLLNMKTRCKNPLSIFQGATITGGKICINLFHKNESSDTLSYTSNIDNLQE